MSEVELRKMLVHAKKQYALSITPKDRVLWRNRFQVLEAELKELKDQASCKEGLERKS